MRENYLFLNLPEGEVTIRWPHVLSAESVYEMRQFIELVITSIQRRTLLQKENQE